MQMRLVKKCWMGIVSSVCFPQRHSERPVATLKADDGEECSICSWLLDRSNRFCMYDSYRRPDNQDHMSTEEPLWWATHISVLSHGQHKVQIFMRPRPIQTEMEKRTWLQNSNHLMKCFIFSSLSGVSIMSPAAANTRRITACFGCELLWDLGTHSLFLKAFF